MVASGTHRRREFNIQRVINVYTEISSEVYAFLIEKIYVYMHINGKHGKKNCKRKLYRHHTETH